MRANRIIILWLAIVAGLMAPVAAEPVRGRSVPMQVAPDYDKAQLVGQWFEVARSPSRLERDCHAVTADVAEREDSRLTLKIICHKGSVDGPILNLDGVLVEIAPGIFKLRLVRFSQLGDLMVAVLWQSENNDLAVLGSPMGEIGWVWSKSARVDEATLELGRAKLVAAGYAARAIRPVDQAR